LPDREAQIERLRSEWQIRHDAVIAAGGLHIVGTERHESRRIDNQLRGAGRQGVGIVAFLPVARGSAAARLRRRRLGSIMQRLKMPEGEPIEHPIVNRSIAKAQNRVESPTSTSASSCSNATSPTSTPRHLPTAQRTARNPPTSPKRSAT
jgi:preprotein translocase subunit SecA